MFEILYLFFLACLTALIFMSALTVFFKIKKSINKNYLKKCFKLKKGGKK